MSVFYRKIETTIQYLERSFIGRQIENRTYYDSLFLQTKRLIEVAEKYEKFMERNGLHRAAGKIRDEVFRR